jgi:hypothetical protein
MASVHSPANTGQPMPVFTLLCQVMTTLSGL